VKNIILKIENLIKSYPSLDTGAGFTLEIPSLELEEGRIYSLLGPNGSGKTTLLNLLCLLEKPDKGKILYKREEINKTSLCYRRRMGLVMQDPFLFRTTIHNNVAYGLRVRSLSRKEIRKRVLGALKSVGLSDFAGRKACYLSGGEAQRVVFARALVLQPEILFLDEPTANIDKRSTEVIEESIRRINRTGVTIILATHNFSQAYSLTNEVISLLDGRMVTTSPENLFSGIIEEIDGLKEISLSPEIKITLVTEKTGKANISIAPEDIILSRHPLDSSARNSFPGRITQIAGEGERVRLRINTGVEFVALLTKRSFQEMGLNIDSRVYLTFKTSSVKVY